MLRPDGIRALLDRVTDEPIIANLGSATFDLYHAQQRDANFYTWGAMGMVSSIGLGVALAAPEKKVYVIDGDGSLLMNLGSLGTIARQNPKNLVHIVMDNQQWAETGGQPTHTSTGTDLAEIARASGIAHVIRVASLEDFEDALDHAVNEDGPWCIVADIEEHGHGARPPVSAEENLLRFRRTFTD
ncbi:MAG: thiamine pyrophosphate-dependent enzyme [Chloroflexi bacterium]|nr:thiamine pyrophosphate-dependent enzyme [Chloroflexota bacterium]